jgi:subtilisin family serine protease
MKNAIAALCFSAFLFSCSRKSDSPVQPENNPAGQSLKSKTEINQFIRQTYNQQGRFEWQSAPVEMIWSAGEQSDHIYAVGFKPAAETADIKDIIHTIDINGGNWKQAKEQLLNLVLQMERQMDASVTPEKMLAFPEEILPVADLYIRNLNTIKMLRNSNLVRYVEPMGYEPAGAEEAVTRELSSSGCGGYTEDFGLMAGNDYSNIAPGAKQSWNHGFHGVGNAWAKGATGQGVKVFIIDTGISPGKDNFGAAFNQGSSTGRTIEKIVTLPRNTFLGIPIGPVETPADGCGHGTAMAGACAAPRGTDGNAAGVAYNCNLVTCRGAADVFLDESRESKGVADAYTNAANRTDVKIISMSLGRITSSGQITDAINYAYGKGKLMFCAGGTSFGWTAGWVGVIFPAWLSNVNAVTGVQDNLNTRCNACHSGSEIDFTIVMEKAANERYALTTAMSGNQPGTVGGSSVATAQCAGIAALVWSKFPTFTRDQVRSKLVTTASNYPSISGSFGWGRVNADAATN